MEHSLVHRELRELMEHPVQVVVMEQTEHQELQVQVDWMELSLVLQELPEHREVVVKVELLEHLEQVVKMEHYLEVVEHRDQVVHLAVRV